MLQLKAWYKAIQNFAEQWLPIFKVSEPADDRRPYFFKKCTNLKQPYRFNKVHWCIKKLKETMFLLGYQAYEAFGVTKGLYEMEN